ncbi:hypothetical protein BV22DRAFT_1030802 [Leucogyrophana mollusca]|uniref:Uncharacterized protein n=1 Tax=Leucogyrophana mollusca TaxID=85980 RepID=A0ACB8BS03_9AGAM|nr:hypothetical protein BV22DRAFT_1030802 [Leucogyrophana mollusca]
MADSAPSQQLPSWMTLSTIVFTNAEGTPMTSTTTLQLPLTYYGPSIPLGTDGAWTYGGLTSPGPSTSSGASTSATPTTLSSTFATQSSSASASASFTSSTTTSYPYSSTSSLSKGALIGTIFGAICGFALFLLLLICCVRWRARRRRDSGYQSPRSPNTTPIWTGWEIVSPTGRQIDQGDRPPGEGSPRGSGEEADSFLQRSASVTEGTHEAGVRPLPPGAAPPRTPGSLGTATSHNTASTNDYGVVLQDTGRTGANFDFDNGFPARPSSEMTGHIMAPSELLRFDTEHEDAEAPPRMYYAPRSSDPTLPEHYSPLLPPPPIDLVRLPTRKPSDRSMVVEKEKSTRSLSYPASELEDSKILTARRVRVQELGPRSEFEDETSSNTHADPIPGPSSWRHSLRDSIARLGHRSWFNASPSHSNSRSRPESSSGRARSEQDVEAGRSLLGSRNGRSLGLTVEGERPMSSVSAKSAVSGNTVYHDAVSRLGTPVSVPSRAMTPASPRGHGPGGDFVPPVPAGAPPAYDDPYDSFGSRASGNYPQGVDILDIPAPPPASPFSGAAASRTNTPFPPGLVPLSNPRAWRDSLSVITGSSNDAGISIDVLDAEPPRAGDGWRTLASSLSPGIGPNPSERRTTFGVPQVVHPGATMISERGSLHSMRSHLSPYSARSSGSAPTSSRRAFGASNTGSNSSRPSAHSRVLTASSGSLRSGSISSHGRRTGGPISPALSAFGYAGDIDEAGDLNRTSVLGPMPSFASRSAFSTGHPATIRSVGAVSATATSISEDTQLTGTTITGEESDAVMRFPSVPLHETFGAVRTDLV